MHSNIKVIKSLVFNNTLGAWPIGLVAVTVRSREWLHDFRGKPARRLSIPLEGLKLQVRRLSVLHNNFIDIL